MITLYDLVIIIYFTIFFDEIILIVLFLMFDLMFCMFIKNSMCYISFVLFPYRYFDVLLLLQYLE